MNSTNIVDYIKQIVNNKLYNINNWFTKIEINFLVNVLLITKFQVIYYIFLNMNHGPFFFLETKNKTVLLKLLIDMINPLN